MVATSTRRASRQENLDLYGTVLQTLYVEQGLSQAAIGCRLGFSQATIGQWLEALGIQSRPTCRSGPENGRFIHGLEARPYRSMVRKRRCSVCGTTHRLVIHHKDNNHYNNVLSNLQVICSPCHSRMHKLEYWARTPKKTLCVHGHPLSGDNLYVNAKGHRGCKTCRKEIARRHEQSRSRKR